ncbi:unnamed protein product, partial [Heterosigma akashiwo]
MWCKVFPPPGLSALALTAFLAAQNVVATRKHNSVASKSSMTSLAAAKNGVGSTAAATSQFEGCATGTEIGGACYYYNKDSLSRDDSSMTSLAAAKNGVGSTAAATSQFDGCATGTEINGACYYYNEDSLSRDDAQTACEALGGMLA